MSEMKWPYPAKVSQVNRMEADVIVLGGGIAGCMAAINAAKRGQSVILVEKGATKRSGAGGSGMRPLGERRHQPLLPVFLRRIGAGHAGRQRRLTTTASLLI